MLSYGRMGRREKVGEANPRDACSGTYPCSGTDPSLGGVHETFRVSGPETTTLALDGGDTLPEPPAIRE